MTIENTFVSKFLVGFVAIAMALSLVAPAQAQTEAELQAQIDQLMATISALQAQTGATASGSSAAGVCPYAWTRALSSGSTGADVMALQKFLNADISTQVASAGAAGSAGMETSYFGPATAAAVSNFQVKYRDEILTPLGLVNPTGFFGQSSMAKANALCASAPTTPTTPTTPGGSDDDDDDSSVSLSGEAALESFEIEDADDTEIQEGDSDAPVGVVTLEFADGDAEITRIDIILDGTGNTEERPWNVFREFTLWVDGDEVASKRADRKSDYSGDDDILRFTGLSIVAEEDEELEIVIAATVNSVVKGAEDGADWTVGVDSFRFFDADGVATTENSFTGMSGTADFTIEEAGVNDEARVRKSSSDPTSTTLKVEDDTKKSDEYTIFVFDIEVEDDSSDLTLDDAVVNVAVTNPSTASSTITAGGVIADVYLRIDGKRVKGTPKAGSNDTEIDHVIVNNGQTNTVPYTFDFKGLELESDERYKAELSVVFKGQNNYNAYQNGVLVRGSVNNTGWELEGINTTNALTGSQSGNQHTLATVVPIITGVKSSISQAQNQSRSGSIIFEFKLEAEDDDVTLTRAALNAAATLTSSASTSLAKPTPSLTKVSGDATADGNDFIISEGDSATFRLTYSFTATNSDGHNDGDYTINLLTIAGEKVDITSNPLPLAY